MNKLLSAILVSYIVSRVSTAVAPFIKPCRIFQNDDECVLKSAQSALTYLTPGLPNLGIPAIDPLILEDQEFIDTNLMVKFTNITVVGAKKCKFVTLKFTSKNSMTMVVECSAKSKGKYVAKGKIFILPIEGSGDFAIMSNKVRLSIKTKFDTVHGVDGKKHLRVVSVDKHYDIIEPARFNLSNLFDGNAEQSKLILDTLNESWKELIVLGHPIINNGILKVQEIIEKFFAAVPIDELYIE